MKSLKAIFTPYIGNTGANYTTKCPYCDKKNLEWASSDGELTKNYSGTNKCEHFSKITEKKNGDIFFIFRKNISLKHLPPKTITSKISMISIDGEEFEFSKVFSCLDNYLEFHYKDSECMNKLAKLGYMNETNGGAKYPNDKGEKLLEEIEKFHWGKNNG